MKDHEQRCLLLGERIRHSLNPVCFDTLVVGSGPVAMLIADLRYGGESAFSYQDGQTCEAPLFFSIPGKADQFKGHGSIVIGTGIQQSGLDFLGSGLEDLATEGISRHGVVSKKATGESLSSVLVKGREQLNMPVLACWVHKVEQYSGHQEHWDVPQDFAVRLLVKWPDGKEQYVYGRHIDLCLGAGPARHLDPKQMPNEQQRRALEHGDMCYLNETGFESMVSSLIEKASREPHKPLRILILNTHMSSSFIVQLIENPETIFGKDNRPKLEITWVDRGGNFENFERSTYPDDQYLFERYIRYGLDENRGSFLTFDQVSLRIYTNKHDFQCHYSEKGQLTAKWSGIAHAEQFDCFCLSLGQAQHQLHEQLVHEFGSFIPEFLYQNKLVDDIDLLTESMRTTMGFVEEQPALVATRSPNGHVYSWGVSANTALLGVADPKIKSFCQSLNKKNRVFFAPNTHAPGSLAVVLNQLYQVYAMAMLERPEFGSISQLKSRDPLWHLVKYKQQCRAHVLYYATEQELGDVITQSVLNVLGFKAFTKEGEPTSKYVEYAPLCFSLAKALIDKRAELLDRDAFRVELIEEKLQEIFSTVPSELSCDPMTEFYEHFYRIYRYHTISEAMLDFSVLESDSISSAINITSVERKEVKQKLERYIGAYRFGMNSVLDMNLLSMSEPRQHVISDHLPISIQTMAGYDPPVHFISWNLLADVHLPNNFKDFEATYLNVENLDLKSFGYYGKKDNRAICDNFGLFFDLATFITHHPFYQNESHYLRLLRPSSHEEEDISIEEFDQVLSDWIVERLDPEVRQWSGHISDEELQQCRHDILMKIKEKGFFEDFKNSCVTACKLLKHIENSQWEQRLARLSENKSLVNQLKQQDFVTLQECTHPEAFLNKIFGERWEEAYGFLKTKASYRKGGAYSDDLPGDCCVIIYKKSTWKLDESTSPTFLALGHHNKPGIIAKFVTLDETQSLIVGSIHHPGGESENQIDRVLSGLTDSVTPFIINGDFNHTPAELSVPAGTTLTESSSSLGTMGGDDWGGVHIGRNIDLCLHSESLPVEVSTILPIDRTVELEIDPGVVTFQLYSKETADGYHAKAALAEIANITKLYKRLAEEAQKYHRKPPKLELVTLLIPNWDKEGNDFENPEYIENKQRYLRELESALANIPVTVVDFTSPGIAEPYELAYMKGLRNYGITADLMKNNAVIRHRDHPHIQIDTNTDVLDFEQLYLATIGQEAFHWKDALDVTAYNRYFLTVTNKVGFFAPETSMGNSRQFISHLKKAREEFFSQSKEELEASKARNAAYEEIFTVALERAGYVKRVHASHRPGCKDQFHANVMDEGTRQFFHLTPHIAVVARQTWLSKMGTASLGSGAERLKSLDLLAYGDANLSATHMSFIIRRYTGHVALFNPAEYKGLLELVDSKQDIDILTKYFKQIKSQSPGYYLDLLRVIPNIEQGRTLLASMGNEYLLDRSNLLSIDNLCDEVIFVLGVQDNIDLMRLARIFSDLSKALSCMSTKDDPNCLFIQALLINLQDFSLGRLDFETMKNRLDVMKSTDDDSLDSRLLEIKDIVIKKIELLLAQKIDCSRDVLSSFKKEMEGLRPNSPNYKPSP